MDRVPAKSYRVHEPLAAFERTDPDELRKTDSELPAVGVMLLGSTPHDSVGILTDDRNAERAIDGVIITTVGLIAELQVSKRIL